MWLMTPDGMYSIVKHLTLDGMLLVRARQKEHIEAFARALFTHADTVADLHNTPVDHDYPYRLIARQESVARVVEHYALQIDYPCFKSAVRRKEGDTPYLSYLHDVWELGMRWMRFNGNAG